MYRPIIATQLQQIIDLMYKINNQKYGSDADMPLVSMEFNGRNGWLDVRIHPKGSATKTNQHIFKDVNLFKENKASEQLDKIIKLLDLIYIEKKEKEKELDGE